MGSVFFCIILCVFLPFPEKALAWGPAGHRIINANAVKLMPAPLDSFFLAYSDSLALLGDQPDKWKKQDTALKNWHYIDLDLLDVVPFKRVPLERKEAEKRFGKKAIDQAGILPWAIETEYSDLVKAFRKRNWAALRDPLIATAHFIGDGHQPFHVTENYNGQKTGNEGVHFRFEIDLLERFPQKCEQLAKGDLVVPSERIPSLNQRTFDFLKQSFTRLNAANQADIECKTGRPEYDSLYYDCYEKRVGPLLRGQLGRAASQVAAYWYSAWLEAERNNN